MPQGILTIETPTEIPPEKSLETQTTPATIKKTAIIKIIRIIAIIEILAKMATTEIPPPEMIASGVLTRTPPTVMASTHPTRYLFPVLKIF
jgi:hypothetical protein